MLVKGGVQVTVKCTMWCAADLCCEDMSGGRGACTTERDHTNMQQQQLPRATDLYARESSMPHTCLMCPFIPFSQETLGRVSVPAASAFLDRVAKVAAGILAQQDRVASW